MKFRQFFIVIIPFLFFIVGCSQLFEPAVERRIENVEQGLLIEQSDPSWESVSLTERMAFYKVPGVSIAVINNNEIEWAKGYGVLEAGKAEKVTIDTLFQTGSCAKPFVAAAALNHVEKGMLDLDSDVNERLVSWQIPQNEFTSSEKVTLRRMLNHSAGLIEHGYRGYPQGAATPTFLQVLDGEPPANSPPIRVESVPGEQYRYANGGYLITKLLLEDVTGKSFQEILQNTVFDPWGMDSTHFQSPPPTELGEISASGHRGNGRSIAGRWHSYPELGTGAAMWSTPSDMARGLINLMQIYQGEPNPVLSKEMVDQMLTPGLEGRGLGPYVADDGGDRFYFLHPGAVDGFKCYIVAYPKRGQGVVIMTNSDNGEPLRDEILNSVSVEYGWLENNTGLYVGTALAIILVVLGILILRRVKAR